MLVAVAERLCEGFSRAHQRLACEAMSVQIWFEWDLPLVPWLLKAYVLASVCARAAYICSLPKGKGTQLRTTDSMYAVCFRTALSRPNKYDIFSLNMSGSAKIPKYFLEMQMLYNALIFLSSS